MGKAARFVVGSTLVYLTRERGALIVSDGDDEWQVTEEQLAKQYTPVSKLADAFHEEAKEQVDNE